MRGLSLVVASGGHSSWRCAGLSLSRPLLLRSTGSRRAGSVVVAHGPSRSTACGIFPDQGLNPRPLHWQADSQPLRHQGSPKTEGHFKKKDDLLYLKKNRQNTFTRPSSSFSQWEWKRSCLSGCCSYYAATITRLALRLRCGHACILGIKEAVSPEYCFSQNTEIKWLVSFTDFLDKSINTCYKYSFRIDLHENFCELMPHTDALNLKIRWFKVTQKY